MLISPDRLQKVVEAVLMGGGSTAEEAEIVATHLVHANLTGHDSHGVGMVPAYVFIQHMDLLKPKTSVKLVQDDGAILQFDGGRGYGQVVAREAMDQTIARAKETGIALMSLANAHHIGRVGTYGEQALAAGMVSIHFVNVVEHSPLVAPYRGSDARFGTKPFCIGVPGVLTGGGTIQPGNERHNSIINHMIAIVIDPSRLGDRQWMASEIDAMVEYFKASPAQNPDEPVLSPGDPERISEADRRANGIPIDDKTWSEIVEVAKANGVSAEQIEEMVG